MQVALLTELLPLFPPPMQWPVVVISVRLI